MTKPIVAIIGRPNVGKSTLLNRIAGKRLAIVEDMPGTTRDRMFADASWQGVDFHIVDTGGLEPQPTSTITQGVNKQIDSAIQEADVIIFLTDARDGVSTVDKEIAETLRRSRKPVILTVNKADSDRLEMDAAEFYELNLGEPMPVSGLNGRSIADLLDKVVELFPKEKPEPIMSDIVKVSIVGRPNVGKSMLLNGLLGEERVIVDNTPGTTRDAIDTRLDFQGQSVLLIDTAGIRRRGDVEQGVEKYSVMRAEDAIERSDVALLVLDATEMITAQDAHIAGYVHKAFKGMVVVVNKWDLAGKQNITEWNRYISSKLKFMTHAPVLYVSAKTGEGIEYILPQVMQIHTERNRRLSTSAVNDVVLQAVANHTLPHDATRQLKVLYATQAEINPPTFVFFVNDYKLVHFSYQRYLENTLRAAFGFAGTPIRLLFKNRGQS